RRRMRCWGPCLRRAGIEGDDMRRTEFWERMRETFGDSYAGSVAHDQTLSALDGLTVDEALAEGWNVKHVWMAVCEAYGDRIPARIRR
ncbi:MAG: DUF3046 domain-containing protein, partial [Stackebrandtia sp.]